MKFAVFACLSLSLAACSKPATPPVGYFDPTRILADSTVAKAAMEAAGKSVAGQLGEAQRAASEATAAERAPVAADVLQAKRDRAQDLARAYNEALNKARAAAGAKLDVSVAAACAGLAVKRGISLVIVQPGKAPYAAPGVDLTGDVIAALDGPVDELARARAEVQRLETAAQTPPDVRHVAAGRSP
jgi:Skp family chaperone for outer membrane proteins